MLDRARDFAVASVIAAGTAAVLSVLAAIAAIVSWDIVSVELSVLSATAAVVGGVLGYESFTRASARTLDDTQRATLVADLRRCGQVPVIITAVSDDREARRYANQILQAFRDAAWPVRSAWLDQYPQNAPNTDIVVAMKNLDEPSREARQLTLTLQRVGLRVTRGSSPRVVDEHTVELFIGRRP
jgi:hypothetical protein